MQSICHTRNRSCSDFRVPMILDTDSHASTLLMFSLASTNALHTFELGHNTGICLNDLCSFGTKLDIWIETWDWYTPQMVATKLVISSTASCYLPATSSEKRNVLYLVRDAANSKPCVCSVTVHGLWRLDIGAPSGFGTGPLLGSWEVAWLKFDRTACLLRATLTELHSNFQLNPYFTKKWFSKNELEDWELKKVASPCT